MNIPMKSNMAIIVKSKSHVVGLFCFRLLLIYCPLAILIVAWKLYIYDSRSDNSSDLFDNRNAEIKDDHVTIACDVPLLDPFDKSILEFIEHPRDMACDQLQLNMTYVDMNGYLRIDEHSDRFYSELNISYTCHYRTFERKTGARDSLIFYSEEKLLDKPVKLEEDMVEVICKNTGNESTQVYKNYHAHPAEKAERLFATPTDNQLSVLMFYIDSTSYSMLQRNLPETYKYTKEVMKFNYFRAFNKVGDNTYPNMMAILTGKRVMDEQEGMMREMFSGDTQFDPWPLIWKLFSAKGYATMFNEDKPGWGLFHYLLRGFSKKPVDYYYHTYWMAWAWEKHYNKNYSSACSANHANSQLFVDVIRRHLVSMNNSLQFMYNFYTELSHDYNNEIERFDDDLAAFWREMHEGGYLNKTVVVFGSDHGHRFAAIRATLIGLLEERLPFYGIWFPEWFYRQHPNIKKNLERNKNLLSSSFDVYETLKDIQDANFDGSQRKPGSRGLSQLYPLPRNRTCRDAGIPDHYCTCIKQVEVDKYSELAVKVSSYLVYSLNWLLSKNANNLCEKIELAKINSVTLIDFDIKVKQAVHNFDEAREVEIKLMNNSLEETVFPQSFRVSINTVPFDAKFEAIIRMVTVFDKNITTMSVDGNVSRLNAYKGLSDCIKDAELRKYCSCKNVHETKTTNNKLTKNSTTLYFDNV